MLNKPIYLGQAILDLSKTLMYEFHYEYIKPKYDDRARFYLRTRTHFATKLRRSTFTKTYPLMFPDGLTHPIIQRTIPVKYRRV